MKHVCIKTPINSLQLLTCHQLLSTGVTCMLVNLIIMKTEILIKFAHPCGMPSKAK